MRMDQLLSLKGKIALITGASRKQGIGAAIALQFAQAGADIFITYFTPYDQLMPWGGSQEEAQELLAQLRSLSVRAEAMEVDLSDPASASKLFTVAEVRLGAVDILVNNAAYDVSLDILSLTAEQLDAHYQVNVRAATLLCAEFVRRFVPPRTGGRIINLTSGQSITPMPDNLPYAITKGAVEALTFSLAAFTATQGITVNAIDPGPTDTGWMTPELRVKLEAQAPFGRVGLPQDAAHTALFLASDLAAWVTGQIIHARGGF